MTRLQLTEQQTEFYPKENRPCKRYNPGNDRDSIKKDSMDFIKCRKENIWENLRAKINCSVIGLEPFFACPDEMRVCQSIDDAELTLVNFRNLISLSNSAMWDTVCPLPCIQV